MKIYADADALPGALREVLIKAAERVRAETLFVAARPPRVAVSEVVKAVGAGNAFNGADDWIVLNIQAGDLVITADIPLADRALTIGAEVLNLQGEFFTHNNIKNALAMRNLLEELRITGEVTGGPAPFSRKQQEKFTNALNRFLQKKR